MHIAKDDKMDAADVALSEFEPGLCREMGRQLREESRVAGYTWAVCARLIVSALGIKFLAG